MESVGFAGVVSGVAAKGLMGVGVFGVVGRRTFSGSCRPRSTRSSCMVRTESAISGLIGFRESPAILAGDFGFEEKSVLKNDISEIYIYYEQVRLLVVYHQ